MRILPGLLVVGSSVAVQELPDTSEIGEGIEFKCFAIGEEKPNAIEHDKLESTGCAQVYDTIKTANRACSLFEQCLLIGQNSDGYFELFSKSGEGTGMDLENYNLSIPNLNKTETSLVYGNFNVSSNNYLKKIKISQPS